MEKVVDKLKIAVELASKLNEGRPNVLCSIDEEDHIQIVSDTDNLSTMRILHAAVGEILHTLSTSKATSDTEIKESPLEELNNQDNNTIKE